MAKKVHSVRLEDRHEDALQTRTRMLGLNEGEYIRALIDADQRTVLGGQDGDLVNKMINMRNLSLNEITLRVIEALTREFDTRRNKKRSVRTFRKFASKYDIPHKTVSEILKQLVRNEIFIVEEKQAGKISYQWTYLGVTSFPEYAPIITEEDSLISGSVCGALAGILGDYDDIIVFLSSSLKIEENKADLLMKFFLQNYVGYFTWLREVSFPITGVCDPIVFGYYRNQMLDYLLALISNYKSEWKDWETNEVLNLEEIALKIMEYKARRLRK
jgi:DNA-binding HxlR family transcriptional regulator